jgi:iron(III) transport system permease protein
MFSRSLPFLGRSLSVAILVTIVSTLIGASGALAVRRLVFPGRSLIRLLFMVPLVCPPFVGSLSFIMLFGRRGLITNRLMGLSVSPFGWQGIATLEIISFGALAYLVVASGLDRLDTDQEDAARTIGAGERQIFRDVTLRSMKPELATAAVLVFLGSLADFGTPLIIGGAYQTLASDLYTQIIGLYDMKSAAISGLLLLVPSMAVFLFQRRSIVPGAYYATGSPTRDVRYRIPDRGLAVVLAGVAGVYSVVVAMQFGFIVVGAFSTHWNHDFTPTFAHFVTVLSGDLAPFINSLSLALVSALLASWFGVVLAYLIQRRRYPLRRTVDFIATMPAAVPGILFGIGRIYLKGIAQPVLLGTGIIIFILCMFRYLNIGLRAGSALLDHIDPDLEDAARNLGRSDSGAFADISLPLLAPAMYGAFIKVFATTMTTLGAIIFLILPSNKVAVQQLFQIITGSGFEAAAAMGVILMTLTLVLLALFRGLTAKATAALAVRYIS